MNSKFTAVLPTFESLGVGVPDGVDAARIAGEWLQKFAKAVDSQSIDEILSLFAEDCWWRDLLALTWEFRTFRGQERIRTFLQTQLHATGFTNPILNTDVPPEFSKPYPDLGWIQATFQFRTNVGVGTGVFRLIPLPSNIWRAHTVFTNLESLTGYPSKVGPLRSHEHFSGTWTERRQHERDFERTEPTVLVIGSGQTGLDVAARLKYLDVPTLIIDRNARIGDQWRGRYETLCLHDTVWYDHMPYIPFPPGWPVWMPAVKLADWLESYAGALDLNVWTNTTIINATYDKLAGVWTVEVNRGGVKRVLRPKHVVYAGGLAGGVPNIPNIAGAEDFGGKIMHSTTFKTGADFKGKKVFIIGACTSAHDVAQDLHGHDVDVTIYQRDSTYIMSTDKGFPVVHDGFYVEGAPPVDIADRLFASYPHLFLKEFHKRVTQAIKELDKDLLDGLESVGFRVNFGTDGSGFYLNALTRGGGYYLDVGCSQLIIDRKIKLKSDSPLTSLSKTGAKFADGTEIPADVIIFATGFGDFRLALADVFGKEVAQTTKPVWGLDAEGEVNTAWRQSGYPGLWIAMGNLAICRFHSLHLALQIKAIEEGLYGKPYTQ